MARAVFSTEPGTGKARVGLTRADGTSESLTMAVGDTIALMDGYSLRVDYLGGYARLSVVDDWSIPFMYGLLIVATLAVGVSVLVPFRGAWVVLDDAGATPAICKSVSHSRGDAAFVDRVTEKVESVLLEVRQ